MKIDAVGVVSSDLRKTVEFYTLLGFKFAEFKDDEKHLEPETPAGSARLMIDAKDVVRDIIGEEPKPGNTSACAIQYDSTDALNKTAESVKKAGFRVIKEPWDAFWGQRYAVVEDPAGYRVDLYARL